MHDGQSAEISWRDITTAARVARWVTASESVVRGQRRSIPERVDGFRDEGD